MILVIDIGNSDITIGLNSNKRWQHVWRVATSPEKPELFYGVKFRDFFAEANLSVKEVDKIVLSSVVPNISDRIINVIVSLFGKSPIVLGPDIYPKLPIEVLNPYEIGSDLVSNALAAYTMFKSACVVVDFGTALTFTTVSHKGKILGVAIAPGLKTAIRSLSQNTAKLFDVPMVVPQSVLGKNTVHAIQAGILIGYEGLVLSMLQRIRTELNEPKLSTVATGGLSMVINSENNHFTRIEPNLTLEGLLEVTNYV